MPKRKAFYDSEQGVWKLPLTRGEFTIIDLEDVEFLQQWNWSLYQNKQKPKKRYAHRNSYSAGQPRKTVQLHRVVAERAGILIPELQIDHINVNGLDNRRANLRVATNEENCANQNVRTHSKSGVKGVHWHKGTQMWCALIRVHGKAHWLGYTHTIEAAAQLYAEASKRLRGEFGRT